MQNSLASQNSYISKNRNNGTDEIWSRFNQNTNHLNECPSFVRAFASTVTPGMVLFAELKCGSWGCKHCGPRLKWKWYDKQMPKVLEAHYLEKVEIKKEEWGMFRKRLQRIGAKYMAYDRDNGNVLIFANAAIKGEVIKNDPASRIEALVQAIESTPFVKQPISQSRNWTPEPLPSAAVKVEEPPRWKPLDTAKYNTLDEISAELKKAGYESFPYNLDTRLFGSEKGLIAILKREEYFDVLWRLGVLCREAGERRVRGIPLEEAA